LRSIKAYSDVLGVSGREERARKAITSFRHKRPIEEERASEKRRRSGIKKPRKDAAEPRAESIQTISKSEILRKKKRTATKGLRALRPLY